MVYLMFSSPQSWPTGSSWGQFHRPGWSPICWHHCLPQYPLFPLDSGKEWKQSVPNGLQMVYRSFKLNSNARTRIIASRLYASTHHSSCNLQPCLSKLMYSAKWLRELCHILQQQSFEAQQEKKIKWKSLWWNTLIKYRTSKFENLDSLRTSSIWQHRSI